MSQGTINGVSSGSVPCVIFQKRQFRLDWQGGQGLNKCVSLPISQRHHFTGDGHTKPIHTEVLKKEQVLLGLWTCRDWEVHVLSF